MPLYFFGEHANDQGPGVLPFLADPPAEPDVLVPCSGLHCDKNFLTFCLIFLHSRSGLLDIIARLL